MQGDTARRITANAALGMNARSSGRSFHSRGSDWLGTALLRSRLRVTYQVREAPDTGCPRGCSVAGAMRAVPRAVLGSARVPTGVRSPSVHLVATEPPPRSPNVSLLFPRTHPFAGFHAAITILTLPPQPGGRQTGSWSGTGNTHGENHKKCHPSLPTSAPSTHNET